MGKIIKLDTNLLVPTQDFLYEESIKNFLQDYIKNPKKILIPIKQHPTNLEKKLILDGHHRSSIVHFLSKKYPIELYGFESEDRDDLIPELSQDFHYNNGMENWCIMERTEKIIDPYKIKNYKNSINELIEENSHIFTTPKELLNKFSIKEKFFLDSISCKENL